MPKKILVIDDHPETVRLIELTLRRHGYNVVGVQSGAEGIERAQADPPDLILLDVMMPDMDGLAVCRAIRQQEELRHLPIVMFTAKTQVQDKEASFEAGADDYLTKPTRPAELISRVEAILARAEAKQVETTETVETDKLPGASTGETLAADSLLDRDRHLIAVLGARGGAGATTVAINLAASLAEQGHDTTLIDLDTRQGHVAVYLGHEVQQDFGTLLKHSPQTVKDEVERYLVHQRERFHLLLTRPELGREGDYLSKSHVEALTEALIARQNYTVVDLGHNNGRNIYPLLQQASHILICLRPERAAIAATRQLIDHFSQILSRPEKVQALMLDFGLVENVPRRSVESYLGSSLLDVLKVHPHYIADAVNRKMPLIHARPDSVQARRFHRLARHFVPA